jgi:hypothetical protein
MQQPTRENRLSTASSLMCLQMQPFVTPISGALEDGTAVHVGSGGYVEFQRQRFLLSNHHVAAAVAKHSLARKFFDAPEYLRVNQPWHSVSAPEDLAASRVDDTWNHVIHSGMAFPEHRFARARPFKASICLLWGSPTRSLTMQRVLRPSSQSEPRI